MKRWIIQIVLWLLKGNLSLHEMNLLSRGVLDSLSALPISDIITLNKDGSWTIQGRPADPEQIRVLRESARAELDNFAGKLVDQQVEYAAVVTGVHKAEDEKAMIFSRAAIWFSQNRRALLQLLAAEGDSTPQ